MDQLDVLMTGASGFIGSLVASRLQRLGHKITVVSRVQRDDLPFASKVLTWDEDSLLQEAVVNSQVIINLAGESVFGYWTKQKKQKIFDSRVDHTQKLAEFAQHASGLMKWIQASAIGYYGSCVFDPADEATEPGDGFLAETCVAWENAVKDKDLKAKTCFLRIGLVLGTAGGAWPKISFLYRHFLGSSLGDGEQWVSFIHVQDLIEIIIWAATDESANGPYNCVAEEPVKFRDLHHTLSKRFTSFLPPLPAPILRCMMGEASSLALASCRVLPKRLLESGFSFQHPDIKSAIASLTPPR